MIFQRYRKRRSVSRPGLSGRQRSATISARDLATQRRETHSDPRPELAALIVPVAAPRPVAGLERAA